jgi:hypothetical protein
MSTIVLTAPLTEGYRATRWDNPYLYSSPCWYAYSLGDWLQHYGRPLPAKAVMSRGSCVRVDGAVWKFIQNIGWSKIS